MVVSSRMRQMGLFEPPALTADDVAAQEWSTGPRDRSGMAAYVHLIRSPDDPERMPRQDRKRLGLRDPWPHRTIDQTPVVEWRRRILHHLHDREGSTGYPAVDRRQGRPRLGTSFNRLCLELLGVTADVAAGTHLDQALWGLVSDRMLEHTLEAAILFRVDEDLVVVDVNAELDGLGVMRCMQCSQVMPWNPYVDTWDDTCPCSVLDEEEYRAQLLGRRPELDATGRRITR